MGGYRWWGLQTPVQAGLGGLVLALLVGAAVHWFYFMPWRAEIHMTQYEQVPNMGAPPPAADTFLLPSEALAHWLSEMVLLAQDLGLTMTSLNPQAPQFERNWARQWVDVEGVGSYEQIGAFLQRLQPLTPTVRVKVLQVAAQSEGLALSLQLELWLTDEVLP